VSGIAALLAFFLAARGGLHAQEPTPAPPPQEEPAPAPQEGEPPQEEKPKPAEPEAPAKDPETPAPKPEEGTPPKAAPETAAPAAGAAGPDEPEGGAPAPAAPEALPAEDKDLARVRDPSKAYFFLEDCNALLDLWSQSGVVERLELERSAGGRELFALQFGHPGGRPLAERATIFLVGGLDGVSLAGSQAVIHVVTMLLADPRKLPPEAAFVAIPWANPDGLTRWRSRGTGGGRNDRGIDDDGDGLVDEDGPDDLDRDGMILEMLLEDPTGPWARASDPRFLRPAREGDAPRYVRVREGADDDRDGRYNEDGPGGVVLDHNFPVGWEDGKRPESGPWPLSEPDSAALAQLLLARRTAVVLVFQGNHGLLATPGGRVEGGGLPLAEDETIYRNVSTVFSTHTSRAQAGVVTLARAHGGPWSGSLVDWAYAALGALSMEIGVWGPEVQAGPRGAVDAFYRNGKDDEESGRAVGATPFEEAWARWLDDTRGGSGFVDWQPIALDGMPGAFIGGWERDTIQNPPLDVLPQALKGMDPFVLDLATNLPRLEIDVRAAERNGRLFLVKARVKNLGTLPSGVGPEAPANAVRLRLELTPGVTMSAGAPEVSVGHLPGRGASNEYAWLLIAPEGSVVNLVVESAWSPPVVQEVRL